MSEAAGVRDLSEIPDLAERLSPELSAVKRAMSAASQIGRMRPGVSFGIQAGGLGQAPEQPAAGGAATRQGISVSGVLTVVF